MLQCFLCLKGKNRIAQGNALGIQVAPLPQALKGRDNANAQYSIESTSRKRTQSVAPSGISASICAFPRALPWASEFQPVGLGMLPITLRRIVISVAKSF
jgi:hypothetical protein